MHASIARASPDMRLPRFTNARAAAVSADEMARAAFVDRKLAHLRRPPEASLPARTVEVLARPSATLAILTSAAGFAAATKERAYPMQRP